MGAEQFYWNLGTAFDSEGWVLRLGLDIGAVKYGHMYCMCVAIKVTVDFGVEARTTDPQILQLIGTIVFPSLLSQGKSI